MKQILPCVPQFHFNARHVNHNPKGNMCVCVRCMLKWLKGKLFQSIDQRSADAVTSTFAISLISLCVWADAWRICFLQFLGFFPTWQHSLSKVSDSAHAVWLQMWWSWSLRFIFPSLPGHVCNPFPRTRAVVSCRWLASLHLSLISTACAVKRWRRIAHQIRILKRPELDFMWQRDKKMCVWVCALGLLRCKTHKFGKGSYF